MKPLEDYSLPRGHVVNAVDDEKVEDFNEPMNPLTLTEEKARFLQYGIVPKFNMKRAPHKKVPVKNELLPEARWILDTVKKKYGDGESFLAENFGPRIEQAEAARILSQYIRLNNVDGVMAVHWSTELSCSARMIWRGPHLKRNRPEDRKYTLVIKNSVDNQYLRERGIRCLADHEIGTHFHRMWNDGLQPWFSDRQNFGMHRMSSRESQVSEEGLAAINTVLHSATKMLWLPALIYYTACMSEQMTFRELFDHLELYVPSRDQRFKHVMRCKRALQNPVLKGGVGNDQCYFQGAVEILRNLDDVDLTLMYSGKVCYDEISRIKRIARMDCIKIPKFARDPEKYKRALRQIGVVNGLISAPVETITREPRDNITSTTPNGGVKKCNSQPLQTVSRQSWHMTPTPPPIKSKRSFAYIQSRYKKIRDPLSSSAASEPFSNNSGKDFFSRSPLSDMSNDDGNNRNSKTGRSTSNGRADYDDYEGYEKFSRTKHRLLTNRPKSLPNKLKTKRRAKKSSKATVAKTKEIPKASSKKKVWS